MQLRLKRLSIALLTNIVVVFGCLFIGECTSSYVHEILYISVNVSIITIPVLFVVTLVYGVYTIWKERKIHVAEVLFFLSMMAAVVTAIVFYYTFFRR